VDIAEQLATGFQSYWSEW